VLLEAGFPAQSFSMLVGDGSVLGDVLVEHPLTRFIAFTGSKKVGLRINERAAKPRKGQRWIKRVVAEMGGKDAIVVDRETNVDEAVKGVLLSAFGYQGQKCSACSRAIVDAAIYDEFVDKLKAQVAALKVGSAEDPGNYMGPVINASAMKSILDYVEIGKQEGRLVAGGGKAPGDGYFVQPTVIADIDAKARIFQEEIFGPVVSVTTFKTDDEALEIANDTLYGLGAGLWSRDANRCYRMGRAIQAGRVWTNCYHAYPAHAAFGGYKQSGIGRETHAMMLHHYQQTKNLLVSYSPKKLGFF
jgi:acyl-CoA reductase-like NAD-dependent aldehyde dehydrogenase